MNWKISTNFSNIYTFLTILMAFFPLLSIKITSIYIGIWSVISIIFYIYQKGYLITTKKDILNIVFLGSVFLSYFITLLFVSDKKAAAKLLELSTSLILFPLIFIINKQLFNLKLLKNILYIFVLSTLILTIYVYIIMFQQGIGDLLKENDFYNPVFRNLFNDYTKIHLPYLGLYFSFSIYILGIEVLKTKNYKKIIFLTFAIVILLVALLLIAARMAFVGLLIAVLLLIFFRLNIKVKSKLILVSILIFSGLILSVLEPMKSRILNTFNQENVLPYKGQTPEEFNVRTGIYHCVKEIISENFITGVGAINAQNELNTCYSKFEYRNYDDYQHITYNSHNQYFDFIIKFGILGLVILCFTLFWGINNSNIYYFGFIIIFSICLLTENMFSRQVGVVYFVLFNSFFFINKNNFNEKDNCSRLVR